VQARVERFIVEQYTAGRSLRELAELTDRSFSAVRNILDKHGVRRRAAGTRPTARRAGNHNGPMNRRIRPAGLHRLLEPASDQKPQSSRDGGLCSPSANTE
jgi:hypothetical protein